MARFLEENQTDKKIEDFLQKEAFFYEFFSGDNLCK